MKDSTYTHQTYPSHTQPQTWETLNLLLSSCCSKILQLETPIITKPK